MKGRWWIKRILTMIGVCVFTLVLTFFLMHTVKGDPFASTIDNLTAEAHAKYIAQYGLDKSLMHRFLIFISQLISTGDFGVSLRNRTTRIQDVIADSMPASIVIGTLSVVVGTVLGYLAGTLSAYTRNRTVEKLMVGLETVSVIVPVYILAPILQSVFSVRLGILPVSGWGTWNHIILPVVCMIPYLAATVARFTRTEISKIRASAYYIAAIQRGLSERSVFFNHVLRNSIVPIVIVFVSSISAVFSGSFIVENIFAVPGIGRQYMLAISSRDYSVLIGLNFVFTSIYVLFMLAGDFLLNLADPRFRVSSDEP